MKIRNIDPQKSIFVLLVGTLICWAVAGNAAEQWDTKATARVNLRRNPGSNGVILSIIPQGHKVRIIEKKGLWCKVDVEGEIHGRGWVYGKYLEEILPEVPQTDSAVPTVKVEIAAGEQEQEVHPAEPASKVRTEGEKENLRNTPSPGSVSRIDATIQSSVRAGFRDLNNETSALSQTEISAAKKPAQFTPPQAPPRDRTQAEKQKPLNTPPPEKALWSGVTAQPSIRNEFGGGKDKSIAVSKGDVPTVGKPAHILTIQPPQSGIKSDAPGVIEKAASEVPTQEDILPHFKKLPGKKKEPAIAGQRKLLGVKERTASISPAVEENVMPRQAVSHERKGAIYKQESIGLVELTLKLMSIALSCLVILFLHRANKVAMNRYDANKMAISVQP
jgi:uncharacterized protein YraI